jgi:hypothetical protein
MINFSRRHLLLVLTCVTLIAIVFNTNSQAAGRRPNILFLLSDDQRPDTIRALGNGCSRRCVP